MTTNPYFAYSIKSEYLGDTSSLSGTSLPIEILVSAAKTSGQAKKKRTTSRACDVCSIRKTKCDNSRPCRLCVANNVKCTELRVRKKSGPKTFRKKTIDSINSVGAEFVGISADRSLVSQLDSGSSYPNLSPVIQVLVAFPQHVLHECIPFTLPEIIAETLPLVESLESCPHIMGGSIQTNVTRYAVTTLCLVLLEMLQLFNRQPNYNAMLRDLQVHILLIRSACERLLVFGLDRGKAGFDTHYYLALAELHQFSYLVLKSGTDQYKYIHLRAAIAHCELLEPSCEENMYLKAELRSTLQIWERHMLLFGPDRVFRNMEALVLMTRRNNVDDMTKSPFLNACCDLLHVTDFLRDSPHRLPEPFTFTFKHNGTAPGDLSLAYAAHKLNLDAISKSKYLFLGPRENFHIQLLLLAVQFKVLVSSSQKLSHDFVTGEIMSLIMRFNILLAEPALPVKLFMEKFNFTSVLLELLASYLATVPEEEITPEALNGLVQFTTTISAYISERSLRYLEDPQLSVWFGRFYSR